MGRNQAPGLLFVALLTSLLLISSALAQPKGKTVAATGELVDMWCYFEGGDHGPSHKACSTACAKAGNPIGLLQKNGQVYVLAGMQDHQPAKDVLVNHMNEMVTVKGTLVSKGGVNMLYVTSVTPQKK
jgi:hypothetical protein